MKSTQSGTPITHRRGLTGYLAVFAFLFFAQVAAASDNLHKAARVGDLDRITVLLEAGANVNEANGEGQTALHQAANTNHAEVVAALLAAGADPLVSGKGPFGSTGTPLHLAAKRGHVESMRVLLEARVDPNLPDPGVGPPLHFAMYYRRQAAVDLLKSFGARPVSADPIDALIVAANPADGKLIAGTCRACHYLDPGEKGKRRIGPVLWDIVGKPKASVTGFKYSQAMKEAGGTWTYSDLNSFLANPRGFVPGTKMSAVQGIMAPERRAALIRFLRDKSETPAPLPQ